MRISDSELKFHLKKCRENCGPESFVDMALDLRDARAAIRAVLAEYDDHGDIATETVDKIRKCVEG